MNITIASYQLICEAACYTQNFEKYRDRLKKYGIRQKHLRKREIEQVYADATVTALTAEMEYQEHEKLVDSEEEELKRLREIKGRTFAGEKPLFDKQNIYIGRVPKKMAEPTRKLPGDFFGSKKGNIEPSDDCDQAACADDDGGDDDDDHDDHDDDGMMSDQTAETHNSEEPSNRKRRRHSHQDDIRQMRSVGLFSSETDCDGHVDTSCNGDIADDFGDKKEVEGDGGSDNNSGVLKSLGFENREEALKSLGLERVDDANALMDRYD
eukprot:CAMPEP_0197521212 /NCGR_PEP_ID=MMETSP1318-20131121/6493_1 /TAXON_ID=552666 /ORGANISM="Partenskyella glossopodia, Strain RCC365" /LENGTH=266 /DNA_ID=CAMNT_0043073093 /DNA_START=14 /DNA_END=814 /DNA_ORIENTATION=-